MGLTVTGQAGCTTVILIVTVTEGHLKGANGGFPVRERERRRTSIVLWFGYQVVVAVGVGLSKSAMGEGQRQAVLVVCDEDSLEQGAVGGAEGEEHCFKCRVPSTSGLWHPRILCFLLGVVCIHRQQEATDRDA